jgi:hypothetical protein
MRGSDQARGRKHDAIAHLATLDFVMGSDDPWGRRPPELIVQKGGSSS